MSFYAVTLLSTLPPGRVFGLDWQTIISAGINLFNVAVLAFVLTKLLYRPVQKFMRAREQRVAIQLEDANTAKSQAESLKAEYESRLAEVEAEKEAILEDARKQAGENARKLIYGAREEAESIRARAEAEVMRERERVREEVRQVIIEVSAALAEKVIAGRINDEIDERMFGETVAELESAKWLR